MPAASPMKIAANTKPHPAGPPSSVFCTYGWPRPTTTPAAANAPTMPITSPRTTAVRPMNRQPSQIDFTTDGDEIRSLCCRLAISRSV